MGEDQSTNPPVPSPLVPKSAPIPEPAETFPPSGAIPTVPPQAQEAENGPGDPVKALGEAAVTGAVAHRGSFAHVERSTGETPQRVPSPALSQEKPQHSAPNSDSSPPDVAASEPAEESAKAGGWSVLRWFKRRRSADAPPPSIPTRHAETGGDHEPRPRFWRRLSVWISLGLIAAAGIALALLATVFRPDAIVLEPRVILDPLPTPSVSPIATAGESDFLDALPRATIDFGLTAYEALPSGDIYAWPTRAAEGWVLTYVGPDGETMTVTAVQHYNEPDAIAAFEALAPPPFVDLEPTPSPTATPEPSPSVIPVNRGEVRVGGTVVGESVRVQISAVVPEEGEPTPEQAQITWRNGTAVFVMLGAPHVVDALFLEYGV